MKRCFSIAAVLLFATCTARAGDDKATDGPWVNPPTEPVEGTKHLTFRSKALGKDVGFNIYLPPSYEKDKNRRYAVVYHLHGKTDSESTHLYNLRILDKAVKAGEVPELICVYAYAGRHSWFTDWKSGPVKSEQVIRELIAHVDNQFRTVATRAQRGLLGWSMGGFGALKFGLQDPDLACAVVSFGGGFLTTDSAKKGIGGDFQRVFGGDLAYFAAQSPLELVPKRAEAVRGKVALRLAVGTKDGLLDRNRLLHKLLDEHKLPHEYVEIADVGHNPKLVYEAQMVPAFQFFARAFTPKPALKDGAKGTDKEAREAVARALPLLAKGAAGHRAQRTCFACHNQAVPILALTTARSRGFAVDEGDIQKHLVFINKFLEGNRANFLKGKGTGGQADTAGYALYTLELGGWKATPATDAVAEYLLQHHSDKDHWRATSNRPPTEASLFTTTYVALRGLQTYGTAEQTKRVSDRLDVVRGWLAKGAAKDTEDRVFRLLALKRLGAADEEVQAAAKELLKTQDENGGWAQLAALKPDAYATGTALVALRDAAGLATTEPAYQRGVRFLLQTQLEDGSWHVRSRSKPFQAYYESGFPHGTDQYISIAASGWATTALALALPASQGRGEK